MFGESDYHTDVRDAHQIISTGEYTWGLRGEAGPLPILSREAVGGDDKGDGFAEGEDRPVGGDAERVHLKVDRLRRPVAGATTPAEVFARAKIAQGGT